MDSSKVILIIGNGFDLDLGLQTRFSDFANSSYWVSMYNNFPQRHRQLSFIKYLNERKGVDAWFPFESAEKGLFCTYIISSCTIGVYNDFTNKQG